MNTSWHIQNLAKKHKRLFLECVFSGDDLTITQAGGYSIIRLHGGFQQATPGLPSIPGVLLHLALPEGYEVTTMQIHNAVQHPIDGTHCLYPVQSPYLLGDEKEHLQVLREIDAKKFPKMPAYVGPDAKIYQQSTLYPDQVAKPLRKITVGNYPILPLTLFPVQYLPQENLLFVTTRFTLEFELSPTMEKHAPVPQPDPLLQHTWYSLASAMVLNPQLLHAPHPAHDLLHPTYLIVTDAAMKAEFVRLARWKRALGWQARIVTHEEITAGHYGDFSISTAGPARDLCETIRNFLKWARREWHVTQLLIGGDVNIIPMREVAGICLENWHFNHTNANDVASKVCCVRVGNVTRMQTRYPITTTTPILGIESGLMLRYDPASSPAAPGWHFTDSTFTQASVTPTKFLVLTGPASQDTSGFITVTPDCSIPTDMYYSNLVAASYDQPGIHDWDAFNQGLYGYGNHENVSGIDYTPSIAVGRFPCATVDEAHGLISKALRYEQYQQMDDAAMSSAIFAADYLWYPLSVSRASGTAPGDNEFTVINSCTRIRLADIPTGLFHLILEQDAATWELIPYNAQADGHTAFGWYYSTGPNSNNVSALNGVPVATRDIIVQNPAGTVQSLYWLDPSGLDDSGQEQEGMRRIFREHAPAISMHHLLYRDAWSAPTATTADPLTVEFLNAANIEHAFSRGAAFASLSSHGEPGGCCWLGAASAGQLTNGGNLPVVFANSCFTNDIKTDDCLGERLVLNPAGGAIAYCGFTRYGLPGGGTIEQYFWTLLFQAVTTSKSLGEAMMARQQYLSLNDSAGGGKFMATGLNLSGDPALHPWMTPPQRLVLTIDLAAKKPYLRVLSAQGHAVDHALITITQEDNTLFSGITDIFGRLLLPNAKGILSPADRLHPQLMAHYDITASKHGYAPGQLHLNQLSTGIHVSHERLVSPLP